MHFGAMLSGFLIRAPPPSSSVAFHTTSSSVPRSPHLSVACMVPTSESHCAAHLLQSKEAPQPLTVSPDWGVHRRGRAGLLGAFVLPGVSGSHSKAVQLAWRGPEGFTHMPGTSVGMATGWVQLGLCTGALGRGLSSMADLGWSDVSGRPRLQRSLCRDGSRAAVVGPDLELAQLPSTTS